jgi:quercetin dioxygenase-like cupin family protein
MRHMIIGVVFGAILAAGGLTLAQHASDGRGTVTTLSWRDVIEKLDGKEARVTTVEVAYEPGQASPPHRHPGPIFGYVLEGEFELALGDEAARTLKAGETFYEPTGILHGVSRNPNPKTRTRVLAILLHPLDAKDITVPEPHVR